MNCRDFELKILALAREQSMAATEQLSSLAHAKDCTRCAARLAEERALIAGIRVVVKEIRKEEAPTRVEAAVLAVFREQTTAVVMPTALPTQARTWQRAHWKLEAVAAMILILISAVAIVWLSTRSLKPKQEAKKLLPAPLDTPEQTNTNIKRELALGPRRAISGPQIRVPHRTVRHNSNSVEEVTRFFPLMNGEEDLNSLETVQIVRVELPRSALGTVGLPIGREGVRQRVKADVVLGYDGLARAIRFVR